MLTRKDGKVALFALLCGALLQVAVGQTRSTRMTMSPEPVVAALASAGLEVGASQLEFLSHVNATGENPNLQVVSIHNMSAETARVKVRCTDNQECIPFYVLVHDMKGSGSLAKPLVAGNDRPRLESIRALVRGGDHATLILEKADLRISMPVICLQSGVRGQRIRVASTDRKQFYRAEVIAPGTLRGSL
ncbi:MAG: flagella basal body P-ring formation protein FlgA [Acidobacteriia bacterium]|nr:flagella basal body P-ring formation protein FlgA [Terriglobia bacterium]